MTLDDYLDDALGQDYQDGRWDCAIFVARWCDLVSGTSFETMLAGSYRNLLEGLRTWAPKGERPTATIANLAAPHLAAAGWQQFTDPLNEGDVAVFETGDFGLVWRDKGGKFIPNRRLCVIPPDQIRSVWKWKGGA